MKSSTFILFFVHAADLGKTHANAVIKVVLMATVDADVERKQPQAGSSFQILLNSSID